MNDTQPLSPTTRTEDRIHERNRRKTTVTTHAQHLTPGDRLVFDDGEVAVVKTVELAQGYVIVTLAGSMPLKLYPLTVAKVLV